MTQDLTRGVICILNPSGDPAGTGFILAPDLAVTCAHVVEMARSEPGKLVPFRCYGSPE